MIKKNETYILAITGTGENGEGIGKIDGFAVFVPYALPSETVEVVIVKVLKNYAFGKIVKIIRPSAHRVLPQCPVFYKCGGCNFMHCDYELELQIKTQKVRDCITRIGGLDAEVKDTVGCFKTHYRNKSQYPVTPDGIGFFAPRSHRLVPFCDCLIQNEKSNIAAKIVKEYMDMFHVKAYDESTGRGSIRHIYTRVTQTGTVMVCVVTASKNLKNAQSLVSMLINEFGENLSVIQNINPKKTNVILGDETLTLYGNDTITDKIGDLYFEISPHSFFQINPYQTKNLYDKVLSLCEFDGTENVLDLFCGIGTIGLYVSRYVNHVIGVECVPPAIENAKRNAVLNNIKNADFFVGNAEEVAEKFAESDVVIIDPPRKGCDEKLIYSIAKTAPKKVVYVSCNPATLARDLKIFSSLGYFAKTLYPYDMFPKTAHVETVVLLSK